VECAIRRHSSRRRGLRQPPTGWRSAGPSVGASGIESRLHFEAMKSAPGWPLAAENGHAASESAMPHPACRHLLTVFTTTLTNSKTLGVLTTREHAITIALTDRAAAFVLAASASRDSLWCLKK
jgi:hypothetical protein